MSGPADILKEIHRLMRHVSDLEAKIVGGPRALRSAQLALTKQEETLKKAQDDLKQYKVKIHEKEVSVKQQQQHIEKLEKTTVSNKKEYDALKVEIGTVQKSIGKLEDELLEYMGWAEEKQAQVPALEKAVQQAKADLAKVQQENQEKQGRFAEEKERARAELTQVESTVPEELQQDYRRLVAARGVDALSGVQNRNCTACYTEITQQMRNELVQGKFVVCKNCNRMLYVMG